MININKMKFFITVRRVVTLLVCAVALFSCKDTETYADRVDDEKEAIKSFIAGKNFAVTTSMPTDSLEWMDGNKKLFYKYETGVLEGLYYHQVEKGTGAEPQTNWKAYVRYKGYDMTGKLYYDCTAATNPDPLSFILLQNPTSNNNYGRGFQYAVRNLRVGGHCQVIIPFDLANGTLSTVTGGKRSDADEYKPMFYDIWLVALE